MQLKREDPSFETHYLQAQMASGLLTSEFHRAFPTQDAEEAKANVLALKKEVRNKVVGIQRKETVKAIASNVKDIVTFKK
jgi:hypothetical protein